MSESQQAQATFNIEKLYVKDLSLEVPNAPSIFLEQEGPTIDLEIQSAANGVGEGVFEVVLTVTVTSKLGERTAYLAEVQQAGLFTLKGFDDAQMGHMLHAFCPNILFPFAREELASLIGKGGFPPLLLNPINFDGLYMQRLQQQQAAAGAAPAPH